MQIFSSAYTVGSLLSQDETFFYYFVEWMSELSIIIVSHKKQIPRLGLVINSNCIYEGTINNEQVLCLCFHHNSES
jgi:hypothetical protein